jgi:hypothetical protein
MRALLLSLLNGDEKEVDSVIACGVVALVALIAFCVYQIIAAPAAFSPATFAGGASGLVASIGGSKRFRDGPPNLPSGGQ